jgi:GNAT superfamily N-acetyltransferase
LHLLSHKKYAHAAEVYAAAMQIDPLFVYFYPDPVRRAEQLLALYRYKLASSGGKIYSISTAGEGYVLWIPPGGSAEPLLSLDLLSFALRLLCLTPLAALGKMIRYDRFSRALHHALIPTPHWYLEGIAVSPRHQGKGYAGQLIRPILALADAGGIPCYLETQNPRNVPIYERFGFDLLREVVLPGTDVRHFAMLRPYSAGKTLSSRQDGCIFPNVLEKKITNLLKSMFTLYIMNLFALSYHHFGPASSPHDLAIR